jgi:hypothetical protein
MAYELSIERDQPLTIDEWRTAVEIHPLLRFGPIDSVASNPRTGEVIVVRSAEGDASIELDGRWTSMFRWRKGRVTFTARAIESASDPVSKVAFELAKNLGAVVRGEEGETYLPPA